MPQEEHPAAPSLPWRCGSVVIMGAVGLLSRGFLVGLSNLEVNGMDNFLKLLDERKDVQGRQRGLITDNLRWSLASHDLAFPNRLLSTFFSLGQTLPCHRLAHSPYGGLFQPTITQAIRLLSRTPFSAPAARNEPAADIPDPFSSGTLTYTTTGDDSFPAPAAYLSRRHAWVHIFPEGKVHQKEDRTMRYFKWGVARLILESDPCPDLVPMWVEGPDQIMHEAREFPRFLPRPGKAVSVTFGDKVDVEKIFGDLREKWTKLKEKEEGSEKLEVGMLNEGLKYGKEAVNLRKECTMRVREEVLKVRRNRGWPDEDPKAGLVETWALEGPKQEGKMDDESWVKDT
ncbi:Lysophosphatidylcholine acyltransferase [Botryosphaeria dothidea]|uniref:Tafazzin family protein n=1 Tax=Botryosphaeria dothidea TaxID=55169 RepID=A0A8H4NH29_9PEZI|nr:Lysophosphatidylcholine acyltransferase [Botryosphaeria dothidea]